MAGKLVFRVGVSMEEIDDVFPEHHAQPDRRP